MARNPVEQPTPLKSCTIYVRFRKRTIPKSFSSRNSFGNISTAGTNNTPNSFRSIFMTAIAVRQSG
ncbi:hypothetical protein FACS1894189_6380 [Planctomycetales bacterium]|nr:hypothetical protein FACS1894189_6380 [Planctomycetales bacterium]